MTSEEYKRKAVDMIFFCSLYGNEMTKARAARVMKVSRNTVYRMLADGRIKPSSTGRVSTRSIWDIMEGGLA